MGVPAITYRETVYEYYDHGYYRLPNLLSHQCFDFEELRETLGKIVSGELGAAGGDERKALIDYYLTGQDGPLACERIVDVVEKIMDGRSELPKPALQSRLEGWYRANKRRLKKWYKSFLPGSKYRPEFQRHRYPGLSLEELRSRLSRLQQLLGDSKELKIVQISDYVFRISPRSPGVKSPAFKDA
jgi:hypothetical protein